MSTEEGIFSIEDLIRTSQGGKVDEESVEGKLRKRQDEIRNKEIERLVNDKANELGYGYVNLFGFPMSPEALDLLDEETMKANKVACFYYDGGTFRVATTDPKNQEIDKIVAKISSKYHINGSVYMFSERSFDQALEAWRRIPRISRVAGGVEITEADLDKFKNEISDFRKLNDKINEVNISDVVTLFLAAAMKTGASDIHIEAEENGIVVRLRIDGILQEAAIIDKEKWKKIISRMKVLAKVKINVSDVPQDGRFTIFLANDKIDIRASFLPTAFGESVVMRLLRSSSVGLSFDQLGLFPGAYERLNKEIAKPNGLILTTGPTGSGKTTTLYAVLNKLNDSNTKIITLEDPIEYQLQGINQSQINHSKGYKFSDGLRSILRQDPDVVMVGEIRDLETAEIAVEAALTGHLVLSTLHTNDAAGVIPRLVDMGVKPFFLTPALNAIIGQRLVRKICPNCRVVQTLNESEEELLNKILAVISPKAEINIPTSLPTIYKAGKGCAQCNGLGYKGRIGIYEIFTMDEDIKTLTEKEASAFKILQQAIENGMVTMLQDGVLKVLQGMTDLDEVYRVIGKFDYIEDLYDIVISNTIGRGIKVVAGELELAAGMSKNLREVKSVFDKTETKTMLNLVMALAVKSKVGDIHIEPTEKGVKVRYRIDGILQDIVLLEKAHYLPILSKVKVLCGFATNVKKPTMDGRFAVFMADGTKVDCRVSIISGGYGETVVIRILSNEEASLDMDKLGLRAYVYDALARSMRKTKGMLITTGPTGSGKTTTLYSMLTKLNTPEVKIITVEDPIEYQLEGVMQTQINKDEGYTFAAAMRSLLRQNPNIMMIGEIRDQETAEIAIEAALTGHLVLSTIHANSAAGAIARFVGLNVTRQALSSSIECSIGQRLVRRLCPYCRIEDQLSPEILDQVKASLAALDPKLNIKVPSELKFYKPVGCEKCGGLGYRGRVGLYEVIESSPELQKIILNPDATDNDINQVAIKDGMVTMMQDGLIKALDGETSVDEVLRVTS